MMTEQNRTTAKKIVDMRDRVIRQSGNWFRIDLIGEHWQRMVKTGMPDCYITHFVSYGRYKAEDNAWYMLDDFSLQFAEKFFRHALIAAFGRDVQLRRTGEGKPIIKFPAPGGNGGKKILYDGKTREQILKE